MWVGVPEMQIKEHTEIGKKAWLFAKLQSGRARKRINETYRKHLLAEPCTR